MVSLYERAQQCLDCDSPADKVAWTLATSHELASGALTLRDEPDRRPPAVWPGRPSRPTLVDPRNLPRRGLGSEGGRAALLHAVAHIEFNAINLAWDAVARYRNLPEDFYLDWSACAADEARHFTMLAARLADFGMAYGDLPAHDGLWAMARRTAHDVVARMALVPRVLEARGLDVTPGMIERLRAVGDTGSARILGTILQEEIAHVAAGTRWFNWCCQREGREPLSTFQSLLADYMPEGLRGPFNIEARTAAGFSATELEALATTAPA